MLIIKPFIFQPFSEIIVGFSTKIGLNKTAPYFFNLSYNVGDNKETVDQNRVEFFKELGLNEKAVCYQKQVHEDGIKEIDSWGNCGESDALITSKGNLGLAISSADCPVIFIYDPKKKIIAAIHSGWRGTEKKILRKTIQKMGESYNSNPSDMVCYIGPSISKKNYEVGEDVSSRFEEKFVLRNNDSFYLDLAQSNFEILLDMGVNPNNVQVSGLCTYEYESVLHSYRRDGSKSGRALGVIAMKEIP